MAKPEPLSCPWKITDHAVRSYLKLTKQDGHLPFAHASLELIELARRTWESGRAPTYSKRGARVYRTPKPRRLKLVVAQDDKIVDVGAAFEGMNGRKRPPR
jgi:hypothetical protein